MKTRTAFLLLLVISATALFGCDRLRNYPAVKLPDPPQNVRHADSRINYKQSPSIEKMINDLPPGLPFDMTQRLPAEPLKIQTEGEYCGQLRMIKDDYYGFREDNHILAANIPNIQTLLWEPVVKYENDAITGNLFEEWVIQDDGKRHEVTMREGLCWSDGTPVTAYDVKFALDLFKTEHRFIIEGTITEPRVEKEPRRSKVWALKGDVYSALPSIKITGDFNFVITCERPDPGLPLRAAYAENGYLDMVMPSAFLKQWHIDYVHYKQVWLNMRFVGIIPWPTKGEAQKAIENEGTDNADPRESWALLFWKILDSRVGNPSLQYRKWAKTIPTLTPWMLPASFAGNVAGAAVL